jgi:chromosome segregation ATPase
MTAKPLVRRPLVILGVMLTLLVAAATVRAASIWASSSASLTTPPATIASIEMALAREQSRSAVLQDQLDTMHASSDDLAAALWVANAQVTADQATATDLEASLAAAQAKLAKLEAALKAARGGSTATRSGSTTTSTPAPHDDDGGGVDD